MPRLVLDGLSKTYPGSPGRPVAALDGFSLTVDSGELVAVVGPSGSGKTTLLRLIAGLEQPDRGRIVVDGREVTSWPPQDRDLAMVFQNHALMPHLSVAQNLALGLTLRRVPRPQRDQRVRETAELLGLGDCLERLPKELSGGQRQRVALGRAWIRQPSLFLLDEPLASLDAPLRLQMRQEIRRLHAQTGATTLYVTHDQHEAMALGQRIAVLLEARLHQVSSPHDLYFKPVNRRVAAFFGTPAMNFLSGTVEGDADQAVFISPAFALRLNLPKARFTWLTARMGTSVDLGLRPENLFLMPDNSGSSDLTPLQAKLLAIEPQGPDLLLSLQSGAQTLNARVSVQTYPQPETSITLGFDLAQAYWFDGKTGKSLG